VGLKLCSTRSAKYFSLVWRKKRGKCAFRNPLHSLFAAI